MRNECSQAKIGFHMGWENRCSSKPFYAAQVGQSGRPESEYGRTYFISRSDSRSRRVGRRHAQLHMFDVAPSATARPTRGSRREEQPAQSARTAKEDRKRAFTGNPQGRDYWQAPQAYRSHCAYGSCMWRLNVGALSPSASSMSHSPAWSRGGQVCITTRSDGGGHSASTAAIKLPAEWHRHLSFSTIQRYV